MQRTLVINGLCCRAGRGTGRTGMDCPTPARADGGHKTGTLKPLATFSPSLLLGTPTRLRQVIIVNGDRRAAELFTV
jgi:hypothetical protein